MRVNICGIPHEIVEVEDRFDVDLHLGQINYGSTEILINKDLNEPLRKSALCHEILHGILMHTGHEELSNDENFVTGVGTAIAQSFDIKYMEE